MHYNYTKMKLATKYMKLEKKINLSKGTQAQKDIDNQVIICISKKVKYRLIRWGMLAPPRMGK